MGQLTYERLPIVTLAVSGEGAVSIASPASGVTVDANGAITWDLSDAPVYTGMADLATAYRNGIAVNPSALDATALTSVVLAAPGADYAYTDGEQIWGVYPSGVADVTPSLTQGQAGRRLLDRAEARARLVLYCQPDVAPTLTDAEVDALLDDNTLATVWAANTAYQQGDIMVPPVPNGLAYTPARNDGASTYGGTSGATEPENWPLNLRWPGGRWDGFHIDYYTTDRKTVEDGTLRWEVWGVEGAALWDIRRAAHEAWLLKAAKASGEYATSISGFGMHPERVIDQCLRMADRYRPMGIA